MEFRTGDRQLERSIIDGNVLGGLAYGVHITLFIECLHTLIMKPQDGKVKWHIVVLATVNAALGAVAFGCGTRYNEIGFVDHQASIGGPLGFFFGNLETWQNMSLFAASAIMTCACDGIMISRIFILYDKSWYAITPPVLSTIAYIVLSAILLVLSTHPDTAYHLHRTIDLGVSYWITATLTNVYTSALILGRIFYYSLSIRRDMQAATPGSRRNPVFKLILYRISGRGGYQVNTSNDIRSLAVDGKDMYVSIITMLVESFVISSVSGSLYIGAYIKKSFIQFYMGPFYSQIPAIASLLIILRVANGTAWSQRRFHDFSNIHFKSTLAEPDPAISAENLA